MEELVKKAEDCFKDGFNCAQAVFSTFAVPLGMDKEEALKTACGFGSGMAGLQQTCGVVTGACMAIGLKNGKARKEDDEKKQQTYGLVKEFGAEFIQKHGSLNCSELIGCDLGTPEGMAYARENNLFKTKCLEYVKDAAAILEKMGIAR